MRRHEEGGLKKRSKSLLLVRSGYYDGLDGTNFQVLNLKLKDKRIMYIHTYVHMHSYTYICT